MKDLDGSRIGCQPGKITLVDIRGQVAEMVDVDHGSCYVAMNPVNLQGGGCKFYKFFLKHPGAKAGEAHVIGQGGRNRGENVPAMEGGVQRLAVQARAVDNGLSEPCLGWPAVFQKLSERFPPWGRRC